MIKIIRFTALCIASSLLATPAQASDAVGQIAVPSDYRALVGSEAKFVIFVDQPAELTKVCNGFGLPKGDGIPTTMSKFFDGIITSKNDNPIDQPILVWCNDMPSLFMQSSIHIAMRVPSDVVGKVTVSKKDAVDFVGDIMVLTKAVDKDGWKKPKNPGSPVLDSLPVADIAIAVDGHKIGQQIEQLTLLPMGMLMEHAQSRLKSSAKSSKKYADPIVANVVSGAMKDLTTLMKQLEAPLKSTQMLTMAVDVSEKTISLDMDLKVKKSIDVGGGFDDYLIEQLPPGMPMYVAISPEALRWMSQAEFDIAEGLMITNADQVKGFEAVGKSMMSMAAQQQGATLTMTLDTKYQWMNTSTKDGDTYIKAFNQMMSEVSTLGIGITTSKRSDQSWKMVVDGKKLATLIGGSEFEQESHSKKYGGTYGVSYVESANLVMTKQYPLDKPEFPKGTGTIKLSQYLNGSNDGHLIASMAMDLGRIIEHTMRQENKAMGKSKKEGQNPDQATPPKAPELPMNLVLSSSDSKQINLSFTMPSTKTFNYMKALDAFHKKNEMKSDKAKKTSTQ